jgi:hypothetical protein
MNGCARFAGQIDDYVAGRCAPKAACWMTEHAAVCARCRADLAVASALRTTVRAEIARVRAPGRPEEFLADVSARVNQRKATPAVRAGAPGRGDTRSPLLRCWPPAPLSIRRLATLVALLLAFLGLCPMGARHPDRSPHGVDLVTQPPRPGALAPGVAVSGTNPSQPSPPLRDSNRVKMRKQAGAHAGVRTPVRMPGSGEHSPPRSANASPHSGMLAKLTSKHAPPSLRDDLAFLNAHPGIGSRPWVEQSADAQACIEAQVRRQVRVRDDFVQVRFPRLAAVSPQQVAAAAESYKREAAVVDTRLDRAVTVAAKATALSDLCEQLRAGSGIRLIAGRSVADEKVTVFCEKLPLRDVMRQLSRPFGYTWLRSGKTGEYRYELAQDLKSQLLEEELRNRDRNEALLALDREMNRFRNYMDLSPDEALARARTAGPEEKKLLEKYAGSGWGLIQMYFRLSPGEMTALRSGKELRYSQKPKDDQQPPLPAELARGILQSRRDQRLIVQDGKYRLVSAKDHPDGLLLTAVPGARAMVMLRMPQSELGKFTLTGGPGTYISDDSPIPGTFYLFGGADLVSGESPSALDPKNAVANTALSRDPALRVRTTVLPEPSFRGDLSPSPSPVRGGVPVPGIGSRLPSPFRGGLPRRLGEVWNARQARDGGVGGGVPPAEAKVTSADVLEALHRVTGLPVIADFYTRLYPVATVTVQNQPLFDALNQLSDTMRLRWNKDTSSRAAGGWLQFRSTSYFNDRLKEVPNRLLARWAASRKEHGALTLDDLLEIAQLSDAQLDAASMVEGAEEIWGLHEWELAHYWATRPQLRNLAGFTPEQRQQAQTVAGLPFQQMTLAQQRLFLEQAGHAARLTEMGKAVLRVGYTLPGRYEWREPGWRSYIPSPVQETTREAALQAARRLKLDVPEAEIVPTKLDLAVMYAPGGYTPGSLSMHQIRIDRIGSSGWVP